MNKITSFLRKLNSIKGISFINVLITVGLVSSLGLLTTQVIQFQNETTSSLLTDFYIESFLRQYKGYFSAEPNCTATFNGVNANNSGEGSTITEIRRPSGNSIFSLGDYADLSISEMRIKQEDTTLTGAGFKNAHFIVTFQTKHFPTGGNLFVKKIPLIIQTDATDNIINCYDVDTLNSLQSNCDAFDGTFSPNINHCETSNIIPQLTVGPIYDPTLSTSPSFECPEGWSLADGTIGVSGTVKPDARGRFVRGLDLGAGINPNPASLRQLQQDTLATHTHTMYTYNNPCNTDDDAASETPFCKQNTIDRRSIFTGSPYGFASASETRPYNIALLYCIKD